MFSTFAPIDLFILAIGFAMLLKKIADMDRYQSFRTIVLTAILGAIAVYFFVAFVSGGRPLETEDPASHFTLSEM